MVCVRVRSCSTPPPFRADEKYPRGSFPRGGFPGATFGARDRSLGRSIGGWLPVSCPCDGEYLRPVTFRNLTHICRLALFHWRTTGPVPPGRLHALDAADRC